MFLSTTVVEFLQWHLFQNIKVTVVEFFRFDKVKKKVGITDILLKYLFSINKIIKKILPQYFILNYFFRNFLKYIVIMVYL